MKDLKVILKEAREAIKNKDFETSLKLSKTILKDDKSNYMGLVFLGLSLQEVGPKDQAPKAFKKAIGENRENPLAWNGLINYYEKNLTDDLKKELLEAYLTVVKIEPTDKKIIEYCEKIANLIEYGDLNNIVTTMYNCTKKENPSEVLVCEVSKIVVEVLEKSKEVPENLKNIYEDALKTLINNPKALTSQIYSSYLTLLNKAKKLEEVVINAEKMYEIFTSNTISLVWICKVFNQSFVEELDLADKYEAKTFDYCAKLLKIEPDNTMGLFTEAIKLIKDKKLVEAIEILTKVTTARPGLIHAWFLLTETYLNLNLFDEALQPLARSEKLLQSINYSNKTLKNKLDCLSLHILSKSDNKEDWTKGLEITKQIEDENIKNKTASFVLQIQINLGMYSEAEKNLEDLKRRGNSLIYALMSAFLLGKQKKYKEALQVLEKESFEDTEYWLQLGLMYWEVDFEKSLMSFLKAAKCNPNNYLCFLNLGNYYQKTGDFDKSRRCYEKAFKLNSRCSEAGIELSKIYMKLRNWEANLNLLQSLTSGSINKNNSWAWLQLGLNYLEQEDYSNAIDSLRFVVRVQEDNPHCWETLADAYFARGAFTSALKCYQKASELSEHSLYPSLQVASIKQILGLYSEAKDEFTEILVNNEEYILALKGLAETCLCLARQCLRDQRLGTARSHAQFATEKITQAIKKKSELSCLWKILADSCLLVARLPEKHSIMSMSRAVLEDKNREGTAILETEELFNFSVRCYCKAITLTKDNVLLWHDLTVTYLEHAKKCNEQEKRKELVLHALASAKHCTNMDGTMWQFWNILGIAAMKQDPPNYALAQHAFIKAVTLDHNCAMAWSNLGVLYFIMNDIKLANNAFTQGQRSDPNYVNSWIGQALIAEQMGHEEAMDLFRHSTQLAVQQQGGLGYGHWVCQTLSYSKPNEVIYSIHNMHAVPVACDALTWYTEKNPEDSCAWNMLGILRERLGLHRGAEDAFRNAYRYSEKSHRDSTRINLGRLLIKNGKYSEAIEMFTNVQTASTRSGSGLALAYFKAQDYENSYNAYEQALHWLTDEESSQSDMLVALASMAYMFQGKKAAKTLLLQSIQLKPPSVWGLYSTLSLGLLHQDIELATLVLQELNKLKDNVECLEHYAELVSYIYLLQGEHEKAIKEVSKLVHSHPDQASVWNTLAVLLIRLQDAKRAPSAAKCAMATMTLGQNKKMDVSKVLCLVSIASLISGDLKKSRLAAQKAVHYYPNVADSWAVLASSLNCGKSRTTKGSIRNMLNFIDNLSPSKSLLEWTKTQSMICV